jgi:hypothetical protein
LGFQDTVRATARWYRTVGRNTLAEVASEFTRDQIADYQKQAAALELPWAQET